MKKQAETENTRQQDIEAITVAMTEFFIKNISGKDLILWQMEATDIVIEYCQEIKMADSPGLHFLVALRYTLFTDLLEAKTPKERKDCLKKNLPYVFGDRHYKGTKEALANIGEAYLWGFQRFNDEGEDDDLLYFMKNLSSLMHLCNMYSSYEYYQEQLSK